MGTFARQLIGRGAKVPDCKQKEFAERVEKLFQTGGMMEVEYVYLHGKRIARVTFRRYMALVANKVLREKVFGF